MTVLRPLRPELIALLSALLLAAPAARAGDPPPAAGASATLPSARTADLTFSIEGGALLIKDSAASKTFRLHPIAAAVFVLSDGKTSPQEIAKAAANLTGYDADEATVFGALDALADAKLLLARVTPPGGADLGLIVLTDGALGTALVGAPSTAKEGTKVELAKLKAEENQQKSSLSKVRRSEQAEKAQDQEIQQAAKVKEAAIQELRAFRKVKEQQAEEKRKQMVEKEKAALDKAQVAAVNEASLRLKKLAKEEEKKKMQQVKK